MNYLQEILGYTENDNKVCVKCGESKHITEFGHRAFNKGDIPQTYNFCKSCGKIQASALRKMKKHVPFPDEHYECPGCNLTEQQILDKWKSFQYTDTKKWKSSKRTVWRLDHDHNNLTPREYLCDYCNNTVGRCESPKTLRTLAEYLEKYGVNDESL